MKTLEDDLFLGRHVLENDLVSREALLECLYQLSQDRRASHPLGVILVSRGLITDEDLNRILIERVSPSGTWRSLGQALSESDVTPDDAVAGIEKLLAEGTRPTS